MKISSQTMIKPELPSSAPLHSKNRQAATSIADATKKIENCSNSFKKKEILQDLRNSIDSIRNAFHTSFDNDFVDAETKPLQGSELNKLANIPQQLKNLTSDLTKYKK